MALYNNNACNIYRVYIYIYKRTLMKKSSSENGEIPIHFDGKLQNLISRKSIPSFQK